MKTPYIDNRKKKVDNLPKDYIANQLENRELWRRASRRWFELLIIEKDESICESLIQRVGYCIAKSMKKNKN